MRLILPRLFEPHFKLHKGYLFIRYTGLCYAEVGEEFHVNNSPNNTITSTVATKVKEVVMISTPGSMLNAIKLISGAWVPLATVMEYFAPV